MLIIAVSRNHLSRTWTHVSRAFGTRCVVSSTTANQYHSGIRPIALRRLSSTQTSTDKIISNKGPLSCIVQQQIQNGALQEDPEQLELAGRLDALLADIQATDGSVVAASNLSMDWFSDAPAPMLARRDQMSTPRGIYIFGSVGVGKSFLMDLFYAELLQQQTSNTNRNVRRAHFHEFMLDVHQKIHDYKKRHPKSDPLPAVAMMLAEEARILCLDEFQVTDIADATIIKRLFGMLWSSSSIGMVMVATSNRDPNALYEGGLNRFLFLPFIDTLKRRMKIVEMNGSKDYRHAAAASIGNEQSYFWPASNPQSQQSLDYIFESACGSGNTARTNYKIPVRMGRHVTVPCSNDNAAWFDFKDLCEQPLGAADYLAVCEHYSLLIVDHVPPLNASFDAARRFVTLIDAVYESKTRLVLNSQVSLQELFSRFEATVVESQCGDEETMTGEEIPTAPPPEDMMFVKGEGGSSSSAATTMFRTREGGEVEWSATGRIGVSLAQLSAVQEVSFSFQRAESRLVEMNNWVWAKTSAAKRRRP